jgi:hypothetical protein
VQHNVRLGSDVYGRLRNAWTAVSASGVGSSPAAAMVRRGGNGCSGWLGGEVRTMCGSRTGGWSLPCVMSD